MPEEHPLIPIVVGVTGHRDLRPQDEAPLYQAVAAALSRLRARYPHTPILVLSSLAEGADQLCARAACQAGCRLAVPLPAEREAYLAGFSQQGRQGFEELLAKAERSLVVPAQEEAPPAPAMGFYYRQAGIYTAIHSHILLALWDGVEKLSPEGGGTYETVDFMLRENWRGSASKAFFKPPQDGVVWQILTPRRESPPPAGELYALTRYRGGGHAPGEQPDSREDDLYTPALAETDRFNRDALERAEEIAAHTGAAAAELGGEPSQPFSPYLSSLLGMFAAADRLSVHYRNLRLRTLRLLSGLGTLLVLVFLLYDEMESDLMLPGYALLLLGALFVFRRSQKRDYHKKYIHYRLLAEALRVSFYWELGGVGARVWEQYTWSQRGDVVWVKEALAALAVGRSGDEAPRPDAPLILRRGWIDRQLEYHKAAKASKSGRIAFNEGMSRVFLWLSVLMFVAVFILEFFAKEAAAIVIPTGAIEALLLMHPGQAITLRGLMKILLGIVSAGAALLSNYFSKLSLPVQARDNAKMAELYAMAAARLEESALQPEACRQVYYHLGREAIVENGNWLLDYLEQAPDIII